MFCADAGSGRQCQAPGILAPSAHPTCPLTPPRTRLPAGIVIAAAVSLVLLAAAVIFIRRHHRRQKVLRSAMQADSVQPRV
jgi:hypothetical protein